MILSKSRAKAPGAYGLTGETTGASRSPSKGKTLPDKEEFLAKRDYVGAITLLKFLSRNKSRDEESNKWLAYSYFHYGEHGKALELYKTLLQGDDPDPEYHTYGAACLYYMGLYKEAEEMAMAGPKSALQTRILFHCAHKQGDENKLMTYHQQLSDSVEDQLSLAAVHFLRSAYKEATEIYKRLLLDSREHHALNVYIALCYSKLDYYDVSLEILALYLQHYPSSALAINLKACNHFRLYSGKQAESELKALSDRASKENDLIRHNLVVFRQGENAMAVLPPLCGIVPEAKLNLVIHYLRQGEVQEAYALVESLEPSTPQEYILLGVVNACLGQNGSAQHLKRAQQYFQMVGASASECDTIPGRQCMASCFFLLKQFDDVLIFLSSIKSFFTNDDVFNWNHAIALGSTRKWKEAEEQFLAIQSAAMRAEYTYLSWLARSHIMNGKPRSAWELYLRLETSDESYALLQLIANDCYAQGQFFYAAKAFDILERLDPLPDYWEGKRGACIGVFQQIIAGREPNDSLRDVISMLRNTNNQQVEVIIRVMKQWASEHSVMLG